VCVRVHVCVCVRACACGVCVCVKSHPNCGEGGSVGRNVVGQPTDLANRSSLYATFPRSPTGPRTIWPKCMADRPQMGRSASVLVHSSMDFGLRVSLDVYKAIEVPFLVFCRISPFVT
jgi:hypothetical protein